MSWTAGSSWAQTEVQRKTTGSFADYSSVGPETTTKADAAANSPTSTNYSYQVNHRAGNSTWLSAYSNTVTSNTCKDALGKVVNGASSALLNNPYLMKFDSSGNLYIADTTNHAIRKIDTSGTITTLAGLKGAGYSGDTGLATAAKLSGPRGVAVDSSGDLFIADTANNDIRMVYEGGANHYNIGSPTAGHIYLIAGATNQSTGSTDAQGTSAKFSAPKTSRLTAAATCTSRT